MAQYLGEVISREELLKREKNYDQNNVYFMSLGQNMYIDATRVGSLTRYVNHSCEPNALAVKREVDGKTVAILVAGANGIQVGQEVTIDYKFSMSSKKRQECKCGTGSCRGYL